MLLFVCIALALLLIGLVARWKRRKCVVVSEPPKAQPGAPAPYVEPYGGYDDGMPDGPQWFENNPWAFTWTRGSEYRERY